MTGRATFGFELLTIAALGLAAGSSAHAQTLIAGQDFNALSSSFTFTNNALPSGSPLTNQGSMNSGGAGTDFASYWIQTRSNITGPVAPDGDTSDFIGVNAATVTGLPTASPTGATVGAAGDHNYELNDTDGRLEVEFEPVDVSGYEDRELRLFYWIATTDSFESGDRFTISVTDGTNVHVAVDLVSSALNTSRGVWIPVSIDLDDLIENLGFGEQLMLLVAGDTNGGSENIVFDDIAFLSGSDVGPQLLTIPELQGASSVSPYTGSQVQTSGVVTADFQGAEQLSGFFVQDPSGDADPLTSDGIFVSALESLADVGVGEAVTIVGSVAEPGTFTTVVATSITIDGSFGALTPAPVEMPEAINGELERYEGMLIELAEMTVAQTFFLGRYGQMTLSSADDEGVPGRLFQPTNLFDAGSAEAIALAAENQRRLLVLDDGQDVNNLGDNPDPVPYIGAPPPDVIRASDRVVDLVGVLDFGLINSASTLDYRLHPIAAPTFIAQNPRAAAPTFSGLSAVSLNVLNYFTTLGSRGAQTAGELVRQRDKLIDTIEGLNADVYGLVEIQNNTAAIQDLVNGLNAASSPGKYAFIDTGVIGSDEIKVAFIYTPASVTAVGSHAVLTDAVDPRAITTRNRPALAQTFREVATDETFTAVVNHWKSKGSACTTATPGTNEIPDPDLNDGQGNCNLTRMSMAEAMVDWLATAPTGNADSDVLILGDLNSYAKEDPIQVLLAAGYSDLSARIGSGAYSYVFDGQAGYLDHALASLSLASKIQIVAEWHSNADEPKVIDYDTEFNPPGYYAADPYRASDHDPLLIGIRLKPAAAPVPALGGLSAVLASVLLTAGAVLAHTRRRR